MCNSCGKNLKNESKQKIGKQKKNCAEKKERMNQQPICPNPKSSRQSKPKQRLTKIEKIMLRIQPPLAARDRYLHPEHLNCFLEESEKVYIKNPNCKPCPLERSEADAKEIHIAAKKNNKPEQNSDGEGRKSAAEKEGGAGLASTQRKDEEKDGEDEKAGKT